MTAFALLLAFASVIALFLLYQRVQRLEEHIERSDALRESLEDRLRQLEITAKSRIARSDIVTPAASEGISSGEAPEPSIAVLARSHAAALANALEAPPVAPPLPPPLPPQPEPAFTASREPQAWKPVDWERFMGARLFAWLGGLALFLGIAYFVKYSFDRNLIPPSGRVAIGLITGLGLIGAGLRLKARAYAVTAQTLCATGVVVLYAALFVGHTFYHLPWLPTFATFALMTGVTAGAFVMAVRLSARVIAVLGILGGFLTPILISSGKDQPVALFTYIGLLDIGLIAVALRRRWYFLPLLGVVGTAFLELGWAFNYFHDARVGLAWVIFCGFNALFVAGFVFGRRLAGRDVREAKAAAPSYDKGMTWLAWSVGISALTTLLFAGWMLGSAGLAARPWTIFSFVLAADLALLAVAWGWERLAALHLTAGSIAFGYLLVWQSGYLTPPLLGWAEMLILGFTILHVAFPLVLRWRKPDVHWPASVRAFPIPIIAAALPFVLLTHTIVMLPMPDPSSAFATAVVILLVLLVLMGHLQMGVLWLAGLLGVALLEHTWLWDELRATDRPGIVLAWSVVFLACLMAPPILWRRKLEGLHLSWIAAAIAGLPQFHLAYQVIDRFWPNNIMGLVPLAFAVPPALTFAWLQRTTPWDNPTRNARLAWFGGVVLFFATVALPLQFDRQWLTIALALEGAALLWLFRRVPHPGLERVGIGLLLAVFCRLVFNPYVFEYGVRGEWPIWNRWLYLYGVSAAAMFAGARLLQPSRRSFGEIKGQSLLAALGVVLAFLLVNLEIADFFTQPGEFVRFQFAGHFARDMTYTICWALFALALVGVGISRRLAGARWAGLGLLGVTALKLFLHDLARLDHLYRVGALVAVAFIAFTASVLYQRFVSTDSAVSGAPDSRGQM